MIGYNYLITSKRIADNMFDLLDVGVTGGKLALKYLFVEYDYSKHVYYLLHGRNVILYNLSDRFKSLRDKTVEFGDDKSMGVMIFRIKSKKTGRLLQEIRFCYSKVSDIAEILGIVRTDDRFVPLNTIPS